MSKVMSFRIDTIEDSQVVVFPDLGVPHGTSTRLGGFSSDCYASMNLGRMSGDDLEVVERNREKFAQLMGFPIRQNLQMSHGIEVATIDTPEQAQKSWPADACITNHPQVSLSLTTADCVPIFFYDPKVGAIGLAHAGWRGTVAGMARATVEALVERYQCRPENLRVALGPAIGPCCFEVSADVVEVFEQEFGAQPWIRHLPEKKGKIDLHQANLVWLQRAGVSAQQCQLCDLCTSCRDHLFYSYRRDHGKTGRLLSTISLTRFQ